MPMLAESCGCWRAEPAESSGMSLPLLAGDCSTVLPAELGFTGELQQQTSHCKQTFHQQNY